MPEQIRPAAGCTTEQRLFGNVLCAVDGTQGGYDAVDQAARMTGAGGSLTLLEVTSFRSAGQYRSPAIGPLRAKQIMDRAMAVAAGQGVVGQVEVDPASPPAQVILGWAAEHDLLAMGPPTTGWFGGMFTGGATVAAEGSLPTPLLVARPHTDGAERAPHLLVATDGLAGSDQLVDMSARLAHELDARVTLLHATGADHGVVPERIHDQMQRLERGLGLRGSLHLEPGPARSAVIAAALALQASIVVMGSRRLEGMHTVGSVSRRVVHGAPCSVLLVPLERLV